MSIARLPRLLALSLFVLHWQANAAKQWVVHTAKVQLLTVKLLGMSIGAQCAKIGIQS